MMSGRCARVFAVCALTPHHTHQILTKRPERMREYLASRKAALPIMVPIGDGTLEQHPFNSELKPPRNVWLGTSVEDQARADDRIPHLLATPAAVRFLSMEPLLGPINLPFEPGTAWCPICSDIVPDGIGSPHERVHGVEIGDHYDPARHCATGEAMINWIIVGGESGARTSLGWRTCCGPAPANSFSPSTMRRRCGRSSSG